jgi:N-acetylglucosaminyl-diphospho-decaprenol L-rhamnosyltransferase
VVGAAVVIVNFRTAELAARCALAAAGERRVGAVLIVDSASGDGSVAALRSAGLVVLERDHNAGFAAAVNSGIAATDSAVVILLNADAEPRPGALDRLVELLEAHPGTGVAAPRLAFPDGRPQPNGYRRFPGLGTLFAELCVPLGYALIHAPRLDRYRAPEAARHIAHASGAALAVRRAAFDDAGPLDEGYFLYLEETEWQRRVHERGWVIERVPEAEVVHHVRGGGHAADAPSPHFVRSAQRYLAGLGYARRTVRIVLGAAILGSRVGLRLIGAVPAARANALRRAATYDELWKVLRAG